MSRQNFLNLENCYELEKVFIELLHFQYYFSSKLLSATRKFAKEGRSDLVIIGHPKSMTLFSFERLETYIQRMQKKHRFLTFQELDNDSRK